MYGSQSRTRGYVEEIDAMMTGLASQHSGAGREKKEDDVDLSAGIVLKKKVGNTVSKGETICEVYGNDVKKVEKALEEMNNAVKIGKDVPRIPTLIKKMTGR